MQTVCPCATRATTFQLSIEFLQVRQDYGKGVNVNVN
jgi:hypothetical protein